MTTKSFVLLWDACLCSETGYICWRRSLHFNIELILMSFSEWWTLGLRRVRQSLFSSRRKAFRSTKLDDTLVTLFRAFCHRISAYIRSRTEEQAADTFVKWLSLTRPVIITPHLTLIPLSEDFMCNFSAISPGTTLPTTSYSGAGKKWPKRRLPASYPSLMQSDAIWCNKHIRQYGCCILT